MVIDLERGLLLHLVVILLIPLFRVAIPPLVRVLLFEKKYSIWLYPTTQLKSPIKDVPRICGDLDDDIGDGLTGGSNMDEVEASRESSGSVGGAGGRDLRLE